MNGEEAGRLSDGIQWPIEFAIESLARSSMPEEPLDVGRASMQSCPVLRPCACPCESCVDAYKIEGLRPSYVRDLAGM